MLYVGFKDFVVGILVEYFAVVCVKDVVAGGLKGRVHQF